ncbi:MAG: hypothetical protein QXL94_06140 [Candidatus Parvarchaeum sp.]
MSNDTTNIINNLRKYRIPGEILTEEEWQKVIQTTIGGSDIAELLGVGYSNALTVYNRLARISKPRQFRMDYSNPMWWGTRLESSIIEGVIQKHNLKPLLPTDVPRFCYRQGQFRATPDSIAIQDHFYPVIIEAKLTTKPIEQVYERYRVQVNWYLGLFGDCVKRAYLGVLRSWLDFSSYVIEFDKDLFARQLEAANELLEGVRVGKPPITKQILERGSDQINELYGATDKSVLTLQDDDPLLHTIEELRYTISAIKELEQIKTALENRVKTVLQDANELRTSSGEVLIRWDEAKRTSIDTKQLEEFFPEIYHMLKKETKYRKFHVILDKR